MEAVQVIADDLPFVIVEVLVLVEDCLLQLSDVDEPKQEDLLHLFAAVGLAV